MVAKKKGLGRGLGALISKAPAPSPATLPSSGPETIALDRIERNRWQPRVHFDEVRLAELAASIREQGIVQPLLVRRIGDRIELVAGERRLRAAKLAGLTEVPVTIRVMDDDEVLEKTIVENVQREDLTPLEEAKGYRDLAEHFGYTQEEIAGRVGKSRPAVTNALRLLDLPESIRDEVERGALSAGHARALLGVPSVERQLALAREAVREGLSVRALEARTAAAKPTRPARKAPTPSTPDVHVADVESRLSRALGTKVRVEMRSKGGRFVIEFYSDQERERLVDRLLERP